MDNNICEKHAETFYTPDLDEKAEAGWCTACHAEDTQRIKRIRPGYFERLATFAADGDTLASSTSTNALEAVLRRRGHLIDQITYATPINRDLAAAELHELETTVLPLCADHMDNLQLAIADLPARATEEPDALALTLDLREVESVTTQDGIYAS